MFGREFEFQNVLRVWDLLFAENLRPDIVDLTCVAMLLRSRWSLIDADYTTAITALTHYALPDSSGEPRSLVKDAIFLDRNRNTEAGATVIQHYTARRPKQPEGFRSHSSSAVRAAQTPRHRHSPSGSPGRFASSQKQLEGLFQEVAGGLQRRTEGWNVSKTVRSAVGEIHRNMNNYQTSNTRQAGGDIRHLDRPEDATVILQSRLQELQDRNALLSKMLEDAVQSLRSVKLTSKESAAEAEQNLNISLAKIQFVSVYLSDPDIPIPKEENSRDAQTPMSETKSPPEQTETLAAQIPTIGGDEESSKKDAVPVTRKKVNNRTNKVPSRPSLMDSSFSFMLGENRHRSSFVSSVAALPEQKRGSESKGGPAQASTDANTQQDRKGAETEDDGFTLTKLESGRTG